VVMDRVDEEADRWSADISGKVPVALIDPRTLNGLQRLGAGSPVGETRTLYQSEGEADRPREPRLLAQAKEKLQGAEVLIQQGCPSPAMDLLLGALLCAAAVRARQDIAPAPREVGVWLYGKALPEGALTQEQAGLIMRAMALSQGAEAVPETMVRELAGDVALFVEEAAGD